MKVDNVLKGHKECWKSYDDMDEPILCNECPYKQYGDNCARHLIAETIEVLEEYKNLDRYKIYLEMKHEFLKQDAKNYVRDYIAYERGIAPWYVDDSELEDYDYEKLASE